MDISKNPVRKRIKQFLIISGLLIILFTVFLLIGIKLVETGKSYVGASPIINLESGEEFSSSLNGGFHFLMKLESPEIPNAKVSYRIHDKNGIIFEGSLTSNNQLVEYDLPEGADSLVLINECDKEAIIRLSSWKEFLNERGNFGILLISLSILFLITGIVLIVNAIITKRRHKKQNE